MSALNVKCVNATPKQFAKGIKKIAKKYPEIQSDFLQQQPELANKKGEISVKKMSKLLSDEFSAKANEIISDDAKSSIVSELRLYGLSENSTIKEYYKTIFEGLQRNWYDK